MNVPSWARSRPDFFIIGAQKGGTTSLYRYLEQHPAVMRARNKEINFFGDHFANGFAWYLERFPTRWEMFRRQRELGCKVRTGEATPFYLLHPHAPRRVHAAYPKARIIVMLRNPVDRAFSHHAYHVKLGVESLSFEEAVAAEPERLEGELQRMLADDSYPGYNYKMFSYLERGLYAVQLERWFQYFDRSQVHVIRSEDFFSDPESCFVGVQQFLGLPQHKLESYRKFNPGRDTAGLRPDTRTRLLEFFEPHNRRLEELLQREFAWT
jgi:hypothetical protein